jgi:beta-glucanase (GH16 family)
MLSDARRRALRTAVIVTVVASTVWVIPVRVNAAEPVGWQPAFSVSFDDQSTLPAWCTAIDGALGGTYLRPDEVSVSGGELRLGMQQRAFGGRSYTSGGIRCTGATQQYGRYEFRASVPAGAGIDSAAVLWPATGDDQRQVSTVHVRAGQLTVANGYGEGATQSTAAGRFGDGFHLYLIEWAPSGFRVSVDGREMITDAHVSTARRSFGFTLSPVGQPAPTALPAELRIDYLRIWAYEPLASPVSSSASGSSTVDRDGGGHWLRWLSIIAIAAALVAVVAFAVRLTRPRRPSPGHRA